MRVYDPHKTTVEVRQADNHQTNKRVLIIGTVAIVVIFALLYWWFAVNNPGVTATTHA